MKPLELTMNVDMALIYITPQEVAEPAQIPQDYCDDFTPGETRSNIDALVNSALIYDETYNDPGRRESLLVWKARMLRFVEAVYAQQQIMQNHGEIIQLPPASQIQYA